MSTLSIGAAEFIPSSPQPPDEPSANTELICAAEHIRAFVQVAVRAAGGVLGPQIEWQAARAELYGSTVTGTCTEQSDVDLSIRLTRTADSAQPVARADRLSLVEELCSYFVRYPNFGQLVVVDATVPVLSFVLTVDGVAHSCDAVINNDLAVANSQLLKLYLDVDPRARALALLVKLWARRCNAERPALTALSQYAYTLLVVYFLQHCSQPILPNLQSQQLSQSLPVDICGHTFAHCTDLELARNTLQHRNTDTVPELFTQFVSFFACAEVPVGVCFSVGHVLESSQWLCVQDPIDTSRDLTHGKDMDSVKQDFHEAADQPTACLLRLVVEGGGGEVKKNAKVELGGWPAAPQTVPPPSLVTIKHRHTDFQKWPREVLSLKCWTEHRHVSVNNMQIVSHVLSDNAHLFALCGVGHSVLRQLQQEAAASGKLVILSNVAECEGGVAIMISRATRQSLVESGHFGPHICWATIHCPFGKLVLIAVHCTDNQVFESLNEVLLSIGRHTAVLVMGCFNAKLPRSCMQDGVALTGRYCMHRNPNATGELLLQLMWTHGLTAVSTNFCPEKKSKTGSGTYLEGEDCSRIDYVLSSQRCSPSIYDCKVNWGPVIDICGSKQGHGLFEVEWKLRISTKHGSKHASNTVTGLLLKHGT